MGSQHWAPTLSVEAAPSSDSSKGSHLAVSPVPTETAGRIGLLVAGVWEVWGFLSSVSGPAPMRPGWEPQCSSGSRNICFKS